MKDITANTLHRYGDMRFNRRSFLKASAAFGAAIVGGLPLAALADEPVKGGVLKFTVLDGNPGNTLDPANVTTWCENVLHSLLFDPLFTIGEQVEIAAAFERGPQLRGDLRRAQPQ